MATQGTATVDFGAFPGSSHATVDVTGQTAILSTSLVEAWIMPKDTADHLADEHVVESIRVVAGAPTAGVGFTIHALNTNPLAEPLEQVAPQGFRPVAAATYGMGGVPSRGGVGTTLYGLWNVGWVWN